MPTNITSSCPYVIFREKEFGKDHEIYEGPPCEWSRARGATHTLWLGEGPGAGTRPAILLKTRVKVGVDEAPDGSIKWEVWTGRIRMTWPDGTHPCNRPGRGLPAFRVVLSDGSSYVTSMACGVTLDQARAYFMGTTKPDTNLTVTDVRIA